MLFNFFLFRLCLRPIIFHPLLSLAAVVRLPHFVALSAACLPCVISYRPLAQQHCCQRCHCILILPLPSLVACRTVHRPLLPQPTAPILALLRPPPAPALLLIVARPLPALIIIIGARKGTGVDDAGALLVPKIGPKKARSMTMTCRLCPRPRGGGGGVGRRLCPSPWRCFRHRNPARTGILPWILAPKKTERKRECAT